MSSKNTRREVAEYWIGNLAHGLVAEMKRLFAAGKQE